MQQNQTTCPHCGGSTGLPAGMAPREYKSRTEAIEWMRKRFQLLPREVDVLRLTCDGMSNKETAAALGVSVQTVKCHMTQVFKKVGVQGRLKLMIAVLATARDLGGGVQ
jgi:DNA-binding CsgD family transcriptional regulator